MTSAAILRTYINSKWLHTFTSSHYTVNEAPTAYLKTGQSPGECPCFGDVGPLFLTATGP